MVRNAFPEIHGGHRKYYLDLGHRDTCSIADRFGTVHLTALTKSFQTIITNLITREIVCEIKWAHGLGIVPTTVRGTLVDRLQTIKLSPDVERLSAQNEEGWIYMREFVSLDGGRYMSGNRGGYRTIIGGDGRKYRWEYWPEAISLMNVQTRDYVAIYKVMEPGAGVYERLLMPRLQVKDDTIDLDIIFSSLYIMLRKREGWIQTINRSIHMGTHRKLKVFGSWEKDIDDETLYAIECKRRTDVARRLADNRKK